MKINIDDIHNMITECIKIILSEHHSAVNENIEKLGTYILIKINQLLNKYIPNNPFNKNSTIITKDEINYVYPYKKVNKDLKIILDNNLDNSYKAKYFDNCLRINILKFKSMTEEEKLQNIMHELTHYVNEHESNNVLFSSFSSNIAREEANLILYLFNPSECQARATEFKYWLKNNECYNLADSDCITYIYKMSYLLYTIEAETYEDYKNCENEQDSINGSLRLAELTKRMYKNNKLINYKQLNKTDFEKLKASHIHYYAKRFKKYYAMLSKILYDNKIN